MIPDLLLPSGDRANAQGLSKWKDLFCSNKAQDLIEFNADRKITPDYGTSLPLKLSPNIPQPQALYLLIPVPTPAGDVVIALQHVGQGTLTLS
jgi:hypothetical protein